MEKHKCIKTISCAHGSLNNNIWAAKFSADGKVIASGSEDGKLILHALN